jgi:hypothetical protein
MNLSPLIEELQKPEYTGLSDDEIIAAINAKRVVVREPVENWQILKAATTGTYWADLVIASGRADIPVDVRKLAINVLAWVGDPSGNTKTTDLALPSVQLMLLGLVQAGFATQTQIDDLNALANVSKPWTETVGLPVIGLGVLTNARLEINSKSDTNNEPETNNELEMNNDA